MKVLVLGSGSAFTYENFHSNYLIWDSDKRDNLLIDCGSDIRFALKGQGISHRDIKRVYISHLHADHVGGMEFLAFMTFFDPGSAKKIELYANHELMREMWSYSLSGGLHSVEGREMELKDYFDRVPMYINKPVIIKGLGTLNMVQTVHIMNGFEIVNTYGLMIITEQGKKIYFTTDTQFCPDQIMVFYKDANIIIQDCEISEFDSKVHANYKKLMTLPEDIKKKMYLTHFQDGKRPPMEGFLGYLEKGQELDL